MSENGPVAHDGDAPGTPESPELQVLKKCIHCDAVLPLDSFYNKASSADGKAPWCKVDQKRRMRAWRRAHPCYPPDNKKRVRPGKSALYRVYNRAYYRQVVKPKIAALKDINSSK